MDGFSIFFKPAVFTPFWSIGSIVTHVSDIEKSCCLVFTVLAILYPLSIWCLLILYASAVYFFVHTTDGTHYLIINGDWKDLVYFLNNANPNFYSGAKRDWGKFILSFTSSPPCSLSGFALRIIVISLICVRCPLGFHTRVTPCIYRGYIFNEF